MYWCIVEFISCQWPPLFSSSNCGYNVYVDCLFYMQHPASASWTLKHSSDPARNVGASSLTSLHVTTVPVIITCELIAYPSQKVHFLDDEGATGADGDCSYEDGAFDSPWLSSVANVSVVSALLVSFLFVVMMTIVAATDPIIAINTNPTSKT